jgi:FkbM family methyltransferase
MGEAVGGDATPDAGLPGQDVGPVGKQASAWLPPMVSYAQNQEDVRLRRLFPDDYLGFYVDVGANDPLENSVTRYFYERGWCGINVEPVPLYFDRLCAERGRDVNLQVGLSDRSGEATLFECAGGLSSFSRAHVTRTGEEVLREHKVRLTTLAEVCERHARPTIDFVSIDVEGFEAQVLAGADLARWRPRVLVIEATHPNTREPSHCDWEPLVLEAGYHYAAFDGLNRYYVRSEDAALAALLEVGPNVFDNWTPAYWVGLAEKLRARGEKRRFRATGRVVRDWLKRLWASATGVS